MTMTYYQSIATYSSSSSDEESNDIDDEDDVLSSDDENSVRYIRGGGPTANEIGAGLEGMLQMQLQNNNDR